jgi:hypothetical protein
MPTHLPPAAETAPTKQDYCLLKSSGYCVGPLVVTVVVWPGATIGGGIGCCVVVLSVVVVPAGGVGCGA